MYIELEKDKNRFIFEDIKARYEAAQLMLRQAEENEKNADDYFLDCAIKLRKIESERVNVFAEMLKVAAHRVLDSTNKE